jgi:hypothetical protein
MLLSSPELSWARVLPLDTYQNCHSITAIVYYLSTLVVAGSVAALTDGAPKNNQGGQGEAN